MSAFRRVTSLTGGYDIVIPTMSFDINSACSTHMLYRTRVSNEVIQHPQLICRIECIGATHLLFAVHLKCARACACTINVDLDIKFTPHLTSANGEACCCDCDGVSKSSVEITACDAQPSGRLHRSSDSHAIETLKSTVPVENEASHYE